MTCLHSSSVFQLGFSAGLTVLCSEIPHERKAWERCVYNSSDDRESSDELEKDVLHYLLKGNQPIIIVLARGLKERIEPELIKPLEEGRILIITPFDRNVKRVTEQTAEIRNKMMIELADKITVGYASEGGKLEALLKTTEKEIIKLV